MKPALRLISLALLTLLAGCGEPEADLTNPKSHTSGSLSFDYPKNWKITEDLATTETQYVFVETPGNAIVILQSYPQGTTDDLTAYSKDFSESAAEETPIGNMTQSSFTDLPNEAGYRWIKEDFEISLLGESTPHRRLYGTKVIGERRVFLILQVATEDYSKTEGGFELIRDSLQSTKEQDG